MARITLTFILVALVITVQGVPLKYDEIVAAAKSGKWDQVQDLINGDLSKEVVWKPIAFDGVRNLKPADGGHVYGEAEYTYHSAANINGKTSEDAGGHKVINEDGKVKEFDFTPSTDKLAVNPLPVLPLIFDPAPLRATDLHVKPSVPLLPPFAFNNLRNLKPAQGGKVYGEAEFTYHAASNINGKTSENVGGHKVINNNGQIEEFDFTPSTDKTNKLKDFPEALSNLEKEIKTFLKNH